MTVTATASGVETTIAALIDAWNRHDMAAFTALFTTDADFVNVLGARLRGRAEIDEAHVNLHRTIFRKTRLRQVTSSVRFLDGCSALVHMVWEMTGAEKVPGWDVPEVRNGIMTLVMVPEGGRWLVTAAHNTDTIPVSMPKP